MTKLHAGSNSRSPIGVSAQSRFLGNEYSSNGATRELFVCRGVHRRSLQHAAVGHLMSDWEIIHPWRLGKNRDRGRVSVRRDGHRASADVISNIIRAKSSKSIVAIMRASLHAATFIYSLTAKRVAINVS